MFVIGKNVPSPLSTCGRPSKNFEDCSVVSNRRKARYVLKTANPYQVLRTAEMQMRSAGKRSSAAIVGELITASPKRGKLIQKSRISSNKSLSLSADQALVDFPKPNSGNYIRP